MLRPSWVNGNSHLNKLATVEIYEYMYMYVVYPPPRDQWRNDKCGVKLSRQGNRALLRGPLAAVELR